MTLASSRTKTVYHSPDSPGYSSWLGAWSWPGSTPELGFAFTQVTGVPDGSGGFSNPSPAPTVASASSWDSRVRLSHELRAVLSMPTNGDPVTLSTPVPSRPFTGPPHSMSGQPTTRLSDGRYVMRVNDEDRAAAVPAANDGPQTAYLQFWNPATSSWGSRIYPSNPTTTTAQFTRLRELSDGRLLLSGNIWRVAPGTRTGTTWNEWGLWISADGGATWRECLTNPSQPQAWANEWDVAELANGDLLASLRTLDPDDWAKSPRVKTPVRKQAILSHNAGTTDTWTMGTPVFKSTLSAVAPQHPCLVPLNGGTVALHIAQDTGVHYTTDRGTTWTLLLANPKCLYYPNAVLHTDGLVYVFSHFGGDDDWAEHDERIDALVLEVLIDGEPPVVPTPTDPPEDPPMSVPSTPVVLPALHGGTNVYEGPLSVSSSSAGSTSQRYATTTDGTDPVTPTATTGTLYAGPLSFNENTKIKVVGFNADGASGYALKSYYVTPGTGGTRTLADVLADLDVAAAELAVLADDVQALVDEAQAL